MPNRSRPWKETTEQEREKPKFLKAGTMITVDFTKEPLEQEVDGKYGKRAMFLIQTKEFGAVFVSPRQLMRIGEVAKGDFSDKMTVEL